MALKAYASMWERIWYYLIRTFCGLVLIGLVLPIMVIIPISFTSDTMLTYPMPGLSLRWYREFFNAVMWTLSMKNSFIIAGAVTVLATGLGTLDAERFQIGAGGIDGGREAGGSRTDDDDVMESFLQCGLGVGSLVSICIRLWSVAGCP